MALSDICATAAGRHRGGRSSEVDDLAGSQDRGVRAGHVVGRVDLPCPVGALMFTTPSRAIATAVMSPAGCRPASRRPCPGCGGVTGRLGSLGQRRSAHPDRRVRWRRRRAWSAPMRTPPATPPGSIPRRLAIRPMSTSVVGATRRTLIAGIRLWPPTTTAVPAPPASRPIASSTVAAVTNSNCTGMMAAALLTRRLHRPPHLLGAAGDVLDAEVGQGITDGVDDRWRDRRIAHVAGPLRAKRVDRAGRLGPLGLELGEHGRPRDRVGAVGVGEDPSILAVHDLFQQRLADAECDVPARLALHDPGIHHDPEIVDRHVADEVDLTRRLIDLDDRNGVPYG